MMAEKVEFWRKYLDISLEGIILELSMIAIGALLNLTTAQKNTIQESRQSSQERVAASIAWMKNRLGEPLRLAELAGYAGLSIPHYTVLFRKQSGFSPMDWFTRLRVKWACELLDTTQAPIAEIARQAGFPDPYYFTRCFRRVVGLPPRKYRRVPKG